MATKHHPEKVEQTRIRLSELRNEFLSNPVDPDDMPERMMEFSRPDRMRYSTMIDLYLFGPEGIRGNKVTSYAAAHDCEIKHAQKITPELFKRASILDMIDRRREEWREKMMVNSHFVLERAVELLEMVTGQKEFDEEISISEEVSNLEAGQELPEGVEPPTEIKTSRTTKTKRVFNPQAATKILELIGKHEAVNAFRETVDLNIYDNLEDTLRDRQRRVEQMAEARRKLEKKNQNPNGSTE